MISILERFMDNCNITGESTNKNKKEFYTLFVPSTPNPTTGYMIILSKEDVVNTIYQLKMLQKLYLLEV